MTVYERSFTEVRRMLRYLIPHRGARFWDDSSYITPVLVPEDVDLADARVTRKRTQELQLLSWQL